MVIWLIIKSSVLQLCATVFILLGKAEENSSYNALGWVKKSAWNVVIQLKMVKEKTEE